MKIAVIQFNATADKEKNIRRALDFVERAARKKAGFVLLPEVFTFRGPIPHTGGLRGVADTVPGPSLAPFAALAKKYAIFILAGSVYEQARGTKKVYNTSALIDKRGRIAAVYRKMHLFNARIGKKRVRESERFLAGKAPVAAKVGKFKAGLSICYDLRFPELYRGYARTGAHILCVPSAFTRETGRAHWEVLLRARAVENLCYVAAPNQIGDNGQGITHYGNSMIVDPWGKVLARASADREEIIFAEANIKMLMAARRRLPS